MWLLRALPVCRLRRSDSVLDLTPLSGEAKSLAQGTCRPSLEAEGPSFSQS